MRKRMTKAVSPAHRATRRKIRSSRDRSLGTMIGRGTAPETLSRVSVDIAGS